MWAKPHVSADEFAETKSLVEEFGRGVGIELHNKLLQHAKGKGNWV